MRIYLAGPSAELERVKAAAAEIEAAGHTITERWWERIEEDRGGMKTDAGVPWDTLAAAWRWKTGGIQRADRVVALALAGSGLSQGTREEIAFSLGMSHGVEFAVSEFAPALTPDPFPIFVVGDPGPGLAVTAVRIVGTIAEALT